jgi:hypothetical protein
MTTLTKPTAESSAPLGDKGGNEGISYLSYGRHISPLVFHSSYR